MDVSQTSLSLCARKSIKILENTLFCGFCPFDFVRVKSFLVQVGIRHIDYSILQIFENPLPPVNRGFAGRA